MNRKEWNEILDKYLMTNTLHSEEYYKLNDIQKAIIQEIKKSLKRIKSKYDKHN